MRKRIDIFVLIAVLIVGALLWYKLFRVPPQREILNETTSNNTLAANYKDAVYSVNGINVKLTNGYAEMEVAPGSASKLITRYFGNEAIGDLNGDETADVAFLITQDGGGSGTFFYAVAALKTLKGYKGTNAVLLGDRVAPQATEIMDKEIIVNYAERKPNEPMAVQPSVGISKYLRIVNGKLVEVR